MSANAWLMVGILAVTFGLLLKTKLPPVSVFLGALTAAITFGLVPLDQGLKGFSNTGMLTIGALLMVAAGMYSTGAITLITDRLIGRPKTILKAQGKILPPVAIFSAFLNNTPIVAMFIPVIRDLSRTCRLAAKRLYIPLSYASIFGGTCTLIGTATNLVVAGMIIDQIAKKVPGAPPMRELGMFDLSWVGVPLTIIGTAYMMLLSRWLLPKEEEIEDEEIIRRRYRAEFAVEKGSAVIGKTLEELGFVDPVGFELLSLIRPGSSVPERKPGLKLQEGDELAFSAGIDALPDLWSINGLTPKYAYGKMESERSTHSLVETSIAPTCSVIGRKVSDMPLPDSPYNINVVAVSRYGEPIEGELLNAQIEVGDNVVLEVDDSFFNENLNEQEFSLVSRIAGAKIKRYNRAVIATVITVAMVAVVAAGVMNMLNAAMLASGAMLLTGCLTLRQAGRSVEFGTLLVIASAIGLAEAVTTSGLSDVLADLLLKIGGDNLYIALVVVFLGCIFMDTLVTNVASAAFMFPIAVNMAAQLNANFMPFAITLMVGASCSFISPMGYATNLMVYTAGEYEFSDFVKFGVPLTILVGIVTIILTPMFFKF